MSARKNWGIAFLEQARADISAAAVSGMIPTSVRCMLLQMGFEKLGKAFRCVHEERFFYRRIQKSHKGAYAMAFYLASSKSIRGQPIARTLKQGAQDNLKFVRELEKLQPAVARKNAASTGQLEYPWKDTKGAVRWPEKHLTLVRAIASPYPHQDFRPLRLIKFAGEAATAIADWLRGI